MAGLVTRAVTIISEGPNGSTLSATANFVGNEEVIYSEEIAASQTNLEKDVAFAYAGVQVVDIKATMGCTLKFNNSGSPAPQLVLAAGQQIHWDVDEYASNNAKFPPIFLADVTKVYITCTDAGTLTISVLLNVGP